MNEEKRMIMELDVIRGQIDHVDNELVKLIEARMDLSGKVAEYKMQNHLPIYDATREEAKMEQINSKVQNKEYEKYMKEIFCKIMDESKELQKKRMKEQ